jgi:hypothetical protein
MGLLVELVIPDVIYCRMTAKEIGYGIDMLSFWFSESLSVQCYLLTQPLSSVI